MNANATVLGLDIGGANIKIAGIEGVASTVPFALWKQPDKLAKFLALCLRDFPDVVLRTDAIRAIGVTMTGELCDCYATKREGVNRILDAVQKAAKKRLVRIWSTSGHWLSVAEARGQSLAVAASNWHALATFAGRFAPTGTSLLIDIGSTTTDIIPLIDGKPASKGLTDFDRLQTGELVYVGVKRTPIMALGLPSICAEYFADVRDAFIVLGDISEEPHAIDTADDQRGTRAECLARLARMIGADLETAAEARIVEFASACRRAVTENLSNAINQAPTAETILLSGTGEWLMREIVQEFRPSTPIISLSEQLGPDISACAPAYAVAVLASEMPR